MFFRTFPAVGVGSIGTVNSCKNQLKLASFSLRASIALFVMDMLLALQVNRHIRGLEQVTGSL